MQNKKTVISLAVLSLFITTIAVAGIANANGKWGNESPRGFEPEEKQAMIKALDNGDYEAWTEAIGDRPVSEKITEENFDKLVEAHQLAREGNWEEANEIRGELGVPGFFPKNLGIEDRGAMIRALENSDYDAWVKAMGDKPIAEKITEENFDKLVEAFNLAQKGEWEAAKKIHKELEIPFFGPVKQKKMKDFRKFGRDVNGDGFCNRADLE